MGSGEIKSADYINDSTDDFEITDELTRAMIEMSSTGKNTDKIIISQRDFAQKGDSASLDDWNNVLDAYIENIPQDTTDASLSKALVQAKKAKESPQNALKLLAMEHDWCCKEAAILELRIGNPTPDSNKENFLHQMISTSSILLKNNCWEPGQVKVEYKKSTQKPIPAKN